MRHNPPTKMELTLAEMAEIGFARSPEKRGRIEAVLADCHGLNGMLSDLRTLLSAELHAHWAEGNLTLCTRTERQGLGLCSHSLSS